MKLPEGIISDRSATCALLRVVASRVNKRIAAESIIRAANSIAGNVDSTGNKLIVGASATNQNFSFGGDI